MAREAAEVPLDAVAAGDHAVAIAAYTPTADFGADLVFARFAAAAE